LTIDAWIYPTDLSISRPIVEYAGVTGPAGPHLWLSVSASGGLVPGALTANIRDSSSGNHVVGTTTAVLTANQWQHVAVTYDGRGGATAADGIAIYVDGALQGVFRINDAAYVAMENGTAPLEMGREGPQWNMYDGGMDDVRIWNVARTVTQIQGTMNNELAGTETGLIAYWRFNEGLGVRVNDDSPSTNTATLMSGVTWVAGSSMP